MKKNLDITKPRYSEQILPFPSPLVMSRFHCIGNNNNNLLSNHSTAYTLIDQFNNCCKWVQAEDS